MKYQNLGKFKRITPYVNDKLKRLSDTEASFDNIYKMMFEDGTNIFFEESCGYKLKKITYGESKRNVEIIASNLVNTLGNYEYDSTIGLYLDNDHIWIETFWAILKVGCKPLFLNMRLDDRSLESALKNTKAILVVSNGKKFSIPTVDIKDLLKENELKLVDKPFGSELFVMSSGTSKNIKICAYSAIEVKNILLQSAHIIKQNSLIKKHYDGELKLLVFLPFYHIFGFVANYLWFGFYARTFVKLNDFAPNTIQNTIKRHHVTHIFAVPLLWQKTYETAIKEIKSRGDKTYQKFLKGIKLSTKPIIGKIITKFAFKQVRDGLFGDSISYLITGGSMIDKKVLTFFNAIGYRLSNGFGMSEIGITSVELSTNLKYLNGASVGNPLPGVEYKIDENGELFVKGQTTAKYVIEGEQINNIKGNWYPTHDLAKFENDRYYVFGRHDDLVVSITGENLNPNIIEENLIVDNVNALCLINGRDGNAPILLVSINKFLSEEKANKIIDDLKGKLEENNLFEQIGKIELIAEPFIRGDEFKVNRKQIENDYFNGALQRYSLKRETKEENDEVTLKVKELFSTALNKPINEISSDADFFLDEGGTSLDYFVISSKIQDEYGVNISTSETTLHTVKQIVDYIKEKV